MSKKIVFMYEPFLYTSSPSVATLRPRYCHLFFFLDPRRRRRRCRLHRCCLILDLDETMKLFASSSSNVENQISPPLSSPCQTPQPFPPPPPPPPLLPSSPLSHQQPQERNLGGVGGEGEGMDDVGNSALADADSSIVARAHQLIAQPRWAESPHLARLVPSLRPRHVVSILRSHRNPHRAYRFLRWLSQRHSYKQSVDDFIVLLHRLATSLIPASAIRLAVQMVRSCGTREDVLLAVDYLLGRSTKGLELDIFCYNAILIQLGKFNLYDVARDAYRRLLSDGGVEPNLLTFNTVINILCKNGQVNEAGFVFHRLLQWGINPDSFTYTSLILGHCRNHDLESAFQVFNRMTKEKCEPNSATYTTLINGLCDSGRVDEAMDLFWKMVENGVPPTVFTYTVPISALCSAGRINEALGLVSDMRRGKCSPNVQTFTALISGSCKSNDLQLAIGLFHKMIKYEVLPNTITYNSLIQGLLDNGRMESAFKVFDVMVRRCCAPNLRTCNEMIRCYILVGKTEKAMALLHRMLTVGPSPDQVSYNTMIDRYCKVGNHNNAFRLVELMKENGCDPDEWTYTELICGLCKGGKLDLAHKTFEQMVEFGLLANEVTYTALLDGYSKCGKLDIALSLMDKMNRSSCRPNMQTFNSLINGYSKHNQFEEARKLFYEITEHGLAPNVVTYTAIIDGLCKNGDTSLALKVMDEMIMGNCSPNVHTFSALIHGLFQEGKIHEAEKMFAQMNENKLIPDEVAYTTMIDGYMALGKEDFAFSLLKRMVDSGCKPNYRTYSALLGVLQKAKQLMMGQKLTTSELNGISEVCLDYKTLDTDVVSSLLTKLLDFGCKLNIEVYRTLVCGLCRDGRWFEVEQVVKYMIEQGLSPDQEMCSSLLQGYANYLKVNLALNYYNEMTAQDFEPCLLDYKALLCALCKVHRKEEAQDIFCILLLEHWSPDEIVWTVLIDGLKKEGQLDTCREFLHIMEARDCKPTFHTYVILAREVSKEENIETSFAFDPLKT